MHDTSEAVAYHTLATLCEADYRELKKKRGGAPSWSAALQKTRSADARAVDADAEYRALQKNGIALILREDPAFPPLLKEIPWPPFGIYVRGKLPTEQLSLAVVGTRRATASGKAFAHTLAKALGEIGIGVVSGLALGIDSAAHAGCLEGKGRTFAVLANGLDTIYPAAHASLAERILENGGALISEYPPGTPPLPYRFLERNRIVSGLTKGIVVVEAPESSGSLATARFALEQNRDVFVVPGPATHPNFAGSHELIRSGATLVASPAHVLEAFGIGAAAQLAFAPENEEERAIYDALKNNGAPMDIDKLIELTTLKPHIVNQTISFLTVKNAVKEDGSGYTIA